MKIYWSKQHGAYITAITAWIIGIWISGEIHWLQLAVILFLLSGLNFSELLADKVRRKTPQQRFRSRWLLTYFILSAITGILLLWKHPFMYTVLPMFAAGAIMFAFLSYKKMQKSITSEIIIFGLFTAGGLLAIISVAGNNSYLKSFLLMLAYFCTSIFTVKVRLGRIQPVVPSIYAFLIVNIIYFFGQHSMLEIMIALLIVLKSVPVTIYHKRYVTLPLKIVGIIESISHVLMIATFIVFY